MTKNFYKDFFDLEIKKIKKEQRYRYFNQIKKNNTFPVASTIRDEIEKSIIIWCSNDYLGMSRNSLVTEKAKECINSYGIGSGGTRNISGTHLPIVELEHELADLHCKDKALVFTSGYVANESTIGALTTILKEPVIFSDENNHASIISGIKKSKGLK